MSQQVVVNTNRNWYNNPEIGGVQDTDNEDFSNDYSDKKQKIESNSSNKLPAHIPALTRSISRLSNLSKVIALPSGSMRATVFQLVTGCVGGGTLTLSYGIYMAGALPSIIYLILSTLAQAYTAYTIVYCAHINKCYSFRKLCIKLYNKSFGKFIQCSLLLLLWSISISYMTFTKNLIGPAMQNLLNEHDKWYDNGILILTILLCTIIIPLALKRDISGLRYAALFGFFAVCFTVIVVIILYFNWCDEDIEHNGDNNPDRNCIFTHATATVTNTEVFNSDLINHTYTVAIMIGGYCVQPTILPLYFRMKDHTPKLMKYCLLYSFLCIFLLYLFVAYCGYYTFPNTVSQNLLTSNYGNTDLILISQISLSIYVVLTVPLFTHAFRQSVAELLLRNQKNIDNVTLLMQNEPSVDIDEHNKYRLSSGKHVTITFLYLFSAYGVAVAADNIGTVNSFICSTVLPIICFFFPAAIAWKTPNVSRTMIWLTTLIFIVTTANSILQIIRQIIAWT